MGAPQSDVGVLLRVGIIEPAPVRGAIVAAPDNFVSTAR